MVSQMAPEVIRCESYSSSADVYSFGILMYCIVSAEDYPYRDRYITPTQAAMAVARKELRPNMTSRLPLAVKQIISMCWSGDAGLRPTMDQVVSMLEQTSKESASAKELEGQEPTSSFSSWFRM